MPGGAGRLSSGGGGQAVAPVRHRGAVLDGRAPPGAVTRARSGRPAGGRRSRECPDAGQAGRCPVRLVRSAMGMSVQPVERTSSVQASGVQVSGASRCPDGPASGVGGAAAGLSALCWTWSGWGWRAAPSWARPVDVPP
jgi:hypothetical protein